jgi:hypothetical protein
MSLSRFWSIFRSRCSSDADALRFGAVFFDVTVLGLLGFGELRPFARDAPLLLLVGGLALDRDLAPSVRRATVAGFFFFAMRAFRPKNPRNMHA